MKFSVDILIRFEHCDPAGIVFYPRYFEMFNRVVEDWFARGLDTDFRCLLDDMKSGVPTVHTDCDFMLSSRLGDTVTFDLTVERIKSSSFTLNVTAHADGQERLRAKLILAFVSLDGKIKAVPIPDLIRDKMTRYLCD
ncbi:MAG: thioesterase family protein [Sedimenticola sp.]